MERKKPITLFLGGNDTLLTPERVDRQKNELQFHLERNADNKNVWALLLRNPFRQRRRPVDASVGLARGTAELTEATFIFRARRTGVLLMWAWLCLLVVCITVFFWMVFRRGLLRDAGPTSPYSLGRCQMAVVLPHQRSVCDHLDY